MVVCNHAAVQGQHLNNTVMYTPIYAGAQRESLIGFFAINVHWIEIGGIQTGSTDIFMEGLQLRSIKLWSKGEPIEEVYRIIENNTRMPLELMGDIAAQLAGCLLGRDLTAELADKYGVATFGRAVELILDQSEAAARAFIAAMPDGIYLTETYLDNDRSGDTPVPIKVKVIVAGDELTVDYSELAGQAKGPINSGYFGGGQTTARVAFKYLLGAAEMANEGTFRPIKLILPPGKLLSADPSAPMFMYPTPFPTVIDAIIKALENALPARVPGGHFGTHSGVRFYGRRPNGSFFDSHDSGHGGWGACATHDGAGPFRTMAHGDTRIIPLELQEAMLPFRIEEFSLRQDSAGAGTFRGGLRIPQDLSDAGALQSGHQSRSHHLSALGRAGRQGSQARPLHHPPGRSGAAGTHRQGERPSARGRRRGLRGDRRRRRLWAAGRAALALIERDLAAGYVSAAAAERDYGVRIGRDGKAHR